MGPISYFVCATPRTGSSLLLGLLASTGVCGRPQSYFRKPDEPLWAARWQLPARRTRQDFVRAAMAYGSTSNGVFGAKVMWGDQDWIDEVPGEKVFVHLRREDVVAQAVSWARAEQTGKWFEGGDGEISGRVETGREPQFDRDRIGALITVIDEHDAGWHAWFAARDVTPLLLTYESLSSDFAGSIGEIGRALGLTVSTAPQPRHRRQADHLNQEWARRYQASIAGS